MADVFSLTKSLCIALLEKPCDSSLSNLHNHCSMLTSDQLVIYFEFIALPLRHILKTVTKSDLQSKCLQELVFLLKTSCIQLSSDISLVLLNEISQIINHHSSTASLTQSFSDEFQLECIAYVHQILVNISKENNSLLGTANHLPLVAHLLSILLDVAQHSKNRNLQCKALATIGQFFHCPHNEDTNSRMQQADLLAAVFPGVNTAMFKIVCGDDKLGQNVKSAALTTWKNCLCLIVADKNLILNASSAKSHSEFDSELSKLIVNRDAAWLLTVQDHFTSILENLVKKISWHDDNWRIHHSLVEFASCILNDCSKSLAACRDTCVQCLVTVSESSYSVVSDLAHRQLYRYSTVSVPLHIGPQKTFLCPGSRVINDIVARKLEHDLLTLPRIIRQIDDGAKQSVLKTIVGYMKILGGQLDSMLLSSSFCKRFCLSLIQSLEFDVSQINLIEDAHHSYDKSCQDLSSLDRKRHPRLHLFPKQFKHFSDHRTLSILGDILRLVATYCGHVTLVNGVCRDLMLEVPAYFNSGLTVQISIISGSINQSQEGSPTIDTTFIESILCQYLTRELLDRPTVCSETNTQFQSISARELKENTLSICLIMELIATCSAMYSARYLSSDGPEDSRFMMLCLYTVLSKAAQPPAVLASSAEACLHHLVVQLRYKSVSHLLNHNSDYLLDTITRRLHTSRNEPEEVQSAVYALTVLINNSDSEILKYLHPMIIQMLVSLDEVYEEQSSVFLPLLSVMIRAFRRWFPVSSVQQMKEGGNTADSSHLPRSRIVASTRKFLKERRQFLKSAGIKVPGQHDVKEEEDHLERQGDNDLGEGEMETEDFEDEKDARPVIPLHIRIIEQILTRSMQLLSCPRKKLRLLSLNTLSEGFRTLVDHQDILLPLVHKVWSPLTLRFSDSDLTVAQNAFETLCVLCEVAGDFVRSRVCKEIVQPLAKFFSNNAKLSWKCSPSYKYSVIFKVQKKLLDLIPHLCIQIQMDSTSLETILSSLIPYLSCFQPIELQQATVRSISQLYTMQSGLVWYKIHQYVSAPVIYCHESHSLPDIKLPSISRPHKQEYDANVLKLIHEFSSSIYLKE